MSVPATYEWDIDSSGNEAQQLAPRYKGDTPNFWLGAIGLAILSLLGFVVAFVVYSLMAFGVGEFWLRGIDASNASLASSRQAFLAFSRFEQFQANILQFLASVFVVSSIWPILIWRGKIWIRFSVSFCWLVCFALLTESNRLYGFAPYETVSSKALPALGVIVTWLAILLLSNLKSILRSGLLRMVVNYGLMILALCVCVASLKQPNVSWIVALHANYCIVLLTALYIRNFLMFAMLERDSTADEIMPTSTGTLIELTAVCSLLLVFITAWLTMLDGYATRHLTQYVLVCLASTILVGLVQLRSTTGWTKLRILNFILVPIAFSFAVLVASVDLNWSSRSNSFIGYQSIFDYSLDQLVWLIPPIGFAVVLIVVSIWLQDRWLRYCGWTNARRVSTKEAVASTSIE